MSKTIKIVLFSAFFLIFSQIILSFFFSEEYLKYTGSFFLNQHNDFERIFSILKETGRKNTLETQLAQLSEKYVRLRLKGKKAFDEYSELRKQLPAGDIFLVRVQEYSWKMLFSETKLKILSLEDAGKMASIAKIPTVKLDRIQNTLASFSKNISRKIGFPYSAILQVPGMDGKLIYINVPEKKKVLFWQTYKKSSNYSDILIAIYDLENIEENFSEKRIVSYSASLDFPLGFVSVSPPAIILSKSFSSFPGIENYLMALLRREKSVPGKIDFGEVKIISGKAVSENGFVPVVLSGTAKKFNNSIPYIFSISIAFLVFLLLYLSSFFNPLKIFSHHIIASVVMRILGAAIIPIVAAGFIFSITLSQIVDSSVEKLKDSLHETLTRLDDDVKYLNNEISQKIWETIGKPSTKEAIRNIRLTKNPKLILKDFADSTLQTMKRTEDRIGHEFSFNLLSLKATDSFYVALKKTSENKNFELHESENSSNFIAVLQDLVFYNLLTRMNDSGDDKMMSEKRFMLKIEMLIDIMVNFSGSDNLLTFVKPGRVNLGYIKLNTGRYFFSNNIIFAGPKNPYFLFWVWDEYLTSEPYLLERLKNEQSTNNGLELIASPKPLIGLEKTYESNTNLNNRFLLNRLIRDSYESNDLVKSFTKSDKGVKTDYHEAFPGKRLTQYILAGSVSTKGTEDFAISERISFISTMLIIIITSVLTVFFMINSLFRPLKDIQSAMERISRNDFQCNLSISGNDEIGRIAIAFNKMTELLAQGKLLGHYVSESVQKIISDENFRKNALAGEEKEITVVFSQIKDFEKIQRSGNPVLLTGIMNLHLEVFKNLTVIYGGEIDKVFENKVMIVFDHLFAETPDKAVSSAINLVINAQQEISRYNPEIKLSIGINSGKAIAGIVGANKFRITYTVIGDTVNVAARLANFSEDFHEEIISVSGDSMRLLKDRSVFSVIKSETCFVKGKNEPTEIFCLKGH
ncbi:MAG: adenylate/guanylate cyclase domain-containing protein [Candidatus Riflebacteria bacterium]|nr:adenylate/guanylate cyclase domain-containing protein [Candidatus Riflebacteria bacterium]